MEFADLGVTDCNAPLLGRTAPVDADSAEEIWRLLVDAFKGFDAIRFRLRDRLREWMRDTGDPLLPLVAASA